MIFDLGVSLRLEGQKVKFKMKYIRNQMRSYLFVFLIFLPLANSNTLW